MVLKTSYNPQNFFGPDEPLYHAEQNGTTMFVFGQNCNFLWIKKKNMVFLPQDWVKGRQALVP